MSAMRIYGSLPAIGSKRNYLDEDVLGASSSIWNHRSVLPHATATQTGPGGCGIARCGLPGAFARSSHDGWRQALAKSMLAVVPGELHRAPFQSTALRLDREALQVDGTRARRALRDRVEGRHHG